MTPRAPRRASAVLRARLAAQGLAGPPLAGGDAGPGAVAARLLAVQAQDPRGFRLAIRARTRGTTAADVDRALGEERSLVVTWLNRGTLHLVAREDYPLLQGLLAPWWRTAVMTRLAGLGIDADAADRAVGIVDRALADSGPLSRAALGERLRAAGVPTDGQRLVHVLFRASLDGVVVRGPVAGGSGGEQLYVRVADWLPEAPAAVKAMRREPERGYVELVRRYLVGHGPADPRDIARWLGVPLGYVRPALAELGSRVVEADDGLVALAATVERPARLRPPRLLGAFEPLLLGWRSRTDVLGEHESRVISGGLFRGFALGGGHAVAVWRFGGPSGVEIDPFPGMSDRVGDALARDVAPLLRFLGR